MAGSCNWGRVLLSSVVFATVAWASGWLVWGKLFNSDVMDYAHLWRPAGSMEMVVFPLLGFLVAGLGVSCLYSKFFSCSMQSRCIKKDLWFGSKLWLVAVGIASLPFYGYSPVSTTLLFACVFDKALVFIPGTVAVGWIMCGGMSDHADAG